MFGVAQTNVKKNYQFANFYNPVNDEACIVLSPFWSSETKATLTVKMSNTLPFDMSKFSCLNI